MQHVQRRIAERFVWVLAILVAAAGLVAAQTIALDVTTAGANPCEKGQAGANNPNCQDGEFTPPEDDEADEDEGEGGGAPALPASCSELVDALADGGAPAELTDGLQQLCDAIEGDDGEPGDEEPGDGEPGDEEPGTGGPCSDLVEAIADGGAPAELTDGLQQLCDALEGDGGGAPEFPPGEAPELPAGCGDLVDALADGGAPAELTDGLQQLCDAAEGGDGEPGDEEPGDGEPGDEDEDAGEGGNALQAGCDDLVDAVADATADELRELGAVCDGLGMLPLDEAPLPLGLR